MKRKIMLFTILLSAMLFYGTADSYAQVQEGAFWYTAKENVNIRSGPSTRYTSYGILNAGEKMGFGSSINLTTPSWKYGYPSNNSTIYNYYIAQGVQISGYVYTEYLQP
jgi:uncharacterized protein YgiM (DUF1202 family)